MEEQTQEKHYVCTGSCRGVSSEPKVCESETCTKHGQPLTECDCADGHHSGVLLPEQDQDGE